MKNRIHPSTSDPSVTEVDRCPASRDLVVGPSDGPWYSTICSNEAFDSERTHDFPDTCNVEQITGEPGKRRGGVAQRVLEGFPSPYSVATRERNELFIYYGTGATADCTDQEARDGLGTKGPMVAKINADTFEVEWKTLLFDTQSDDTWNYPGAMGIHGNGFLYVVSSYRIVKLDPVNGSIIAFQELPTLGDDPDRKPGDTTYNGFVILSDGRIVTKSMQRKAGSTLQSVAALFKAWDFSVRSRVSVIDPEALELLATVELPQSARGRISSSLFQGKEYVYLPGAGSLAGDPANAEVYRFIYDSGSGGSDRDCLKLDPDWEPVRYVPESGEPGAAVALMGDYGVVQTNFSAKIGAVTAPLRLTVFSQDKGSILDEITPFEEWPATGLPGALGITSSQFSLPTVDPRRLRIYIYDWATARFAAIQFEPEPTDPDAPKLRKLWDVQQRTNAFAALVGPEGAKNIVQTSQFFKLERSSHEKIDLDELNAPDDSNPLVLYEKLIWRNARTGEVLLESQLGRGGEGLPVGIGFNGRFYTLTLNGELIEHSPE